MEFLYRMLHSLYCTLNPFQPFLNTGNNLALLCLLFLLQVGIFGNRYRESL